MPVLTVLRALGITFLNLSIERVLSRMFHTNRHPYRAIERAESLRDKPLIRPELGFRLGVLVLRPRAAFVIRTQ